MKKFILVLVMILTLGTEPARALNSGIYKEGIYRLSDFHMLSTEHITVQNPSNSIMSVTVYDESLSVEQFIVLRPNSGRYSLVPMETEYKIIVAGEGSISVESRP